jgi:hypothetical protein
MSFINKDFDFKLGEKAHVTNLSNKIKKKDAEGQNSCKIAD